MVQLASLLLVDPIDRCDKLTVAMPPTFLLAFSPLSVVPSLVHGLGPSLALVFAKDCLDGLHAKGMACSEVK